MKKKGFKLLALAVITACCFGISAASAFAAGVETKTAMNGASIRTADPTGLRFEAVVDATTYDSVIKDAGKSFGAFILPKDYLEAANITEISNHKDQFAAPKVEKYLEKEGIEGEQKGSEYVLKYSIAQLHYYNYNREFVGMFFIKTVGADNTVSYQYFTVNEVNNEVNNVRSVAFVAKAAIENGSEVPDAAYDFAIAAKYLEVNGYDSTIGEATQKAEAYAFVTANKEGFKTAYADIKAAADIETINILDTTQKPKIVVARNAYNGADAVIKDLLDDFGIYRKFEANETDYLKAESEGMIKTVNDAIAALPKYNVSTVPVVYNKNYKTAKTAYDSLNEEQKAQITNPAKLQEYEAAANKAALVYEDGEYSISRNTTTPNILQITNIPEKIKDYGNISRVYSNSAGENVRLVFNNLPNLKDYDVVRFPIYLDPDKVGTSTWPLVYKFKDQGALAAGYRTLKAGWNIVTVPVSKVANGIEIGANAFAAKTNLYYAIPYAEKLKSGDAIASYKYENDGIYLGGIKAYSGTYQAQVTVTSVKDNENGTVMNVKAEWGSVTTEFKHHYAFKVTNYSELKMIVAETGARSVKFKIKADKDIPRIIMSGVHAEGDIILTAGEWKEIEVTKDQFAKWTGCFLDAWDAPAELQLTDFTIVK